VARSACFLWSGVELVSLTTFVARGGKFRRPKRVGKKRGKQIIENVETARAKQRVTSGAVWTGRPTKGYGRGERIEDES